MACKAGPDNAGANRRCVGSSGTRQHIAIKSVGAGVAELRLNFGPGYRVYCGMDGETLVILLAGGTKQRQSADIAVAKMLWKQYKQGKGS